jgi:U3 small nucleolar RNA-associated protein 23
MLERNLQGKVKVMITQCAMEALYRSKNEEAIGLAKQFERRKCGHRPMRKGGDEEDGTLSAFDCMKSVVNVKGENKHRYVVATQKLRLRQVFHKLPGVPLIYIERSVMLMEDPSPATEQVRRRIDEAKLHTGLNDATPVLQKDGQDEPTNIRKRRGPKEPNPLSAKKKKPENDNHSQPQPEGEKKKRRRRHKHASQKQQPQGNESASN